MKTVHSVRELRAAVAAARRQGLRIGLVPTMGNLHAGHIALVDTARQHADFVVASIFVNPLQFGAGEDLDTYPRTLAEDSRQLNEAHCDLLFAPSVGEMYPNGMDGLTRVRVPGVSEGLCGARRPGHFEGVATVVTKLFQMAQPDVAVFGEKDYQQLAVIRKLVQDLDMPIEIVAQPTVRATDGLALSSRNGYLDDGQRASAPCLYSLLRRLADQLAAGAVIEPVLAAGVAELQAQGLKVDYLELREQSSLQPVGPDACELVLLVAAYLGQTRLIDNLSFRRRPRV